MECIEERLNCIIDDLKHELSIQKQHIDIIIRENEELIKLLKRDNEKLTQMLDEQNKKNKKLIRQLTRLKLHNNSSSNNLLTTDTNIFTSDVAK